jgi:hypothetical protein
MARSTKGPWQPRELELLRCYYEQLGANDMRRYWLPSRTTEAIKFRARQLGLDSDIDREREPTPLHVYRVSR